MPYPDVGSFPLTDVADFPNVTVAFPGEHWSNRKASETITPGEAVMPINSGGQLYVARAASGDSSGDLIGWDPGGARPTGKSGTGSWKKVGTEAGAFAEVMEFRPYNAAGNEGIVTVRSLRTQS
jgi:hypothetical protein